MLGMYIHMHWSYQHPYAARTWTLEDWRSYLTGLRSLGYDFVQIWPMLDSMPPEPTPSDLTFLNKLGDVIRMAHEMDMRVTIVSCPNTIGNARSGSYTFEERPYFSCEWKVNPADPEQVGVLLDGRRKQFAPISHADGIVVIDSDPGGYIGSTNAEFVALMAGHIRVMREHNPASELIYWMHFGWENYNGFWEAAERGDSNAIAGLFENDASVFEETLKLSRERIPEPWSVLANNSLWGHRAATDALGMADKRCGLHYGLIEGEPTFPLTNCDPGLIAEAMQGYAPADYPGGFLANAQTHVLQLPHTYLVAEHWLQATAARPDLETFGEQVVPGLGPLLAKAWGAVEGADAPLMRDLARALRAEAGAEHPAGASSGLYIGSAGRFLTDLAMNLELRATFVELAAAMDSEEDPRPALRGLLDALRPWQGRLGFTDAYGGPLYAGFNAQVARLNDPNINAVLAQSDDWRDPSIRHGILPRLMEAVESYCQSE